MGNAPAGVQSGRDVRDRYYEFDIASLRPGECRWLCCGMLIKPTGGQIKVHYRIHSARSMGDLDGTLEMEMN